VRDFKRAFRLRGRREKERVGGKKQRASGTRLGINPRAGDAFGSVDKQTRSENRKREGGREGEGRKGEGIPTSTQAMDTYRPRSPASRRPSTAAPGLTTCHFSTTPSAASPS